ncbi:spore germination protein, partial [Bacillus cereus]|nr:spore germination protein [Bacillus cereus]
MPSIVGNMVVQNSNGSFNLGDFYNVSPKANTKSYNGSGGSNVAFVVNNFNGVSATNT